MTRDTAKELWLAAQQRLRAKFIREMTELSVTLRAYLDRHQPDYEARKAEHEKCMVEYFGRLYDGKTRPGESHVVAIEFPDNGGPI